MAEISSPIANGVRVARSSVSSRSFAASIGPDPATTAILTRNQQSLSAITSQLAGIAQQMQGFSSSLERISVSIANDAAIERQRDVQKINQERQLAEQQLREGKESVVERKIQNALVAPVQTVAAKAQFTLSRLMTFFTTLLGGWLINQGVETIKAYSEGNTKKLEQIRDNVLKNLGIIGGIYATIRTGLFGLIAKAKQITGKITRGVISGIFLKPFQAVIDLFKKGKNALTGNAASAAPAASSSASMNPLLKSLLPPAAVGAVDAALDVAGGEDPGRATAGAAGGVSGAFLGARLGGIFGPLGALAGGAGGYFYGKGGAKNIFDYLTEDKSNAASTQPTTTLTPSSKDLTMNTKEDGSNQDFSQPPLFGTANVDTSGTSTNQDSQNQNTSSGVTPAGITPTPESSAPMQATISPLPNSQAPQANPQNLGPLPEPAPIVVPSPPSPAANAAPSGQSGSSRPANYAPTFSTSNPENFYTLYSQVHYNVVM